MLRPRQSYMFRLSKAIKLKYVIRDGIVLLVFNITRTDQMQSRDRYYQT